MSDEVNNGKVAIVTGSCRGVGRAIASEFAKAGYSVIINGLDEMALNQAAEDIAKQLVRIIKSSLFQETYQKSKPVNCCWRRLYSYSVE